MLAERHHLLVVPHRFLHQIPFQALITGDVNGRPRFLVEDFLVSYAPSASILKHCVDRDLKRKETLLALAHPTPRDVTGRELIYVAEEVNSAGRRFGDDAVVRIGPDATETGVKEEAGDFDVLHIATHYTEHQVDPLRSALDLAATERDDGQLEVREVMELQVHGMVVLSACATGTDGTIGSRLPEGDDWIGLTRAFIHAGAPSVVATLWPVNDRSTSRFMERFYEYLSINSKSAALSMTQRDMIAGLVPGAAEYASPYFWAPFVLIGSAN
jgi:CHAT domain-containing protein